MPNYPALKRCLGVIGAAVLLVLALPVLLVAVVAIRLTSRGPIIFRQLRVGWQGRTFTIYKLRTMYHPAAQIAGVRPHDHITPVGRVLRLLRIDELPQFVNVLKGDMSLVGPRPLQSTLDHRFAIGLIGYNLRRQVRPGVTGLAKVRRLNAIEEQCQEMLDDDLEYIRRMGLRLDLWILFVLTPWALLRGLFDDDSSPVAAEVAEVAEGQPAPEALT